MKVLYFRSTDGATPTVLARCAEHTADARVLRDRLDGNGRLDTLIALLGAGDEVVVPSARHLADTADGAVAIARRIAAHGATLTLLREGLDGATLTRVIDALEALSGTDLMPAPARRPRRRATPVAVAEIVRLSAARCTIAHIARSVSLSPSTVKRVRRRHRAAWATGAMAPVAAE